MPSSSPAIGTSTDRLNEWPGPSSRRRTRPSLVDEAYQKLRLRILNDELPPGAQALEQEIADALGISRTPVREALIRLEKEGLVEVLPRRGMRVLPLSPTDMREIYELLYSLEPTAAARMAAQSCSRMDQKSLNSNSRRQT